MSLSDRLKTASDKAKSIISEAGGEVKERFKLATDDYKRWSLDARAESVAKKMDALDKRIDEQREIQMELSSQLMFLKNNPIRSGVLAWLSYILGAFSFFGIIYLNSAYQTELGRVFPLARDFSHRTTTPIETPQPTHSPLQAEPLERRVQRVINGIDLSNPNFDIGGYCLRAESRGDVTFDECMGFAVLKAAAR